MIIATKAFSLCLSDFWILQISNCWAIFNGLLTAFAKKTVGIYVGKCSYVHGVSVKLYVWSN